MTIKQDMLRVRKEGNTEYANAIKQQPSYATQLAKTQTDYKERAWIDASGFLPKFSSEEYRQRKADYQAKYGNTVQIPNFEDVIHITPKAQISTEEMAAHQWAQRRNLPSPLRPDQLQLLTYKKTRYLAMLAAPQSPISDAFTSVATSMDNVEDALTTAYWIGRLAAKAAPRLLPKLIPGLGWLSLTTDILNAANIVTYLTGATKGCKALHGELYEKNPFTKTSMAKRMDAAKTRSFGFGAALEILQTTDQLFGVGVCLGGIMGIITQSMGQTFSPDYWQRIGDELAKRNAKEIANLFADGALRDRQTIMETLWKTYDQLHDTAYRLKDKDEQLRRDLAQFGNDLINNARTWATTPPDAQALIDSDPLIGAMILNTGMQDFEPELHHKSFLFLNVALDGVMQWWIKNEPVKKMPDFQHRPLPAPQPKAPDTIALLEELDPDWKSKILWPHIGTPTATPEEIYYTYSHMIKDSFQAYMLKRWNDPAAIPAANQATDFLTNIIRAYSDDHEALTSTTELLSAAVDIMDQGATPTPDTKPEKIAALASYITQEARKTAKAPNIKEIKRKQDELGIKRLTEPTKGSPPNLKDIYPGWTALQDQLGEYYEPFST